jgi:hypothetical protein
LEARLGPKFECATAAGRRDSHSPDHEKKELTSDSSQQGLLLTPRGASGWKVFHAIDRRTRSPFPPRLSDSAGKASLRPKGLAGKDLESSALHGRRRRRLLTWGTRLNKARGAGEAWCPLRRGGRESARHSLGRRPRPGPRRRRFLPLARHVTAIKHVCVRFAAVTS